MDARRAMFQAVRRRLCNSATVAAMVATGNITVSYQAEPTSYPAVRLRVVGGNGLNLDTFLSGDLYVGIYTNNDNPSAHLASIYSVVRSKLHDKQSALTTTNIGVGKIWEAYVDYPLFQEETRKYFLTARYGFTAQNKS